MRAPQSLGGDMITGVAADLVTRFHEQVGRDLVLYMGVIAALVAVLWGSYFLSRTRFTLALAITFLIVGTGLAIGAKTYRAGIQAKIERDIAEVVKDPEATKHRVIHHFGTDMAWSRFSRLLLIWVILIALSAAAILLARTYGPYPAVAGIASALIIASVITLILDARAYARDVQYATSWSKI